MSDVVVVVCSVLLFEIVSDTVVADTELLREEVSVMPAETDIVFVSVIVVISDDICSVETGCVLSVFFSVTAVVTEVIVSCCVIVDVSLILFFDVLVITVLVEVAFSEVCDVVFFVNFAFLKTKS